MTSTQLATTDDQTRALLQQASNHSAQLQSAADATRFARFNEKKSKNTLIAYRRDLQKFGELLSIVTGQPVADTFGHDLTTKPQLWQVITHGEVTAFVLWMQKQGYALSSVNRALYAVRSYAKLAMLSGFMSNEAYAKIAAIDGLSGKEAHNLDEQRDATRRDETEAVEYVKKADATRIPADMVEALLNEHDIETLKGLRNAVMFNLLLQLGLRASELADLKWNDVDLEAGAITFYRRKVAKIQTMGLSVSLQALLRSYMTHFPAPSNADGKLIYGVTRGGNVGKNGMTAAAISMTVKNEGKERGLDTLSAHDLRHHWTTTLHNNKVDNLTLQRMGGWNSPAMLQKYVADKERVNEGNENPYA